MRVVRSQGLRRQHHRDSRRWLPRHRGPVLTGGTVCVPTRATKYTDQGTLTFLAPASGTSRWHRPLTANGDTMACPDGRTLYVLAPPLSGPNGETLDNQHGATLYALQRANSRRYAESPTAGRGVRAP